MDAKLPALCLLPNILFQALKWKVAAIQGFIWKIVLLSRKITKGSRDSKGFGRLEKNEGNNLTSLRNVCFIIHNGYHVSHVIKLLSPLLHNSPFAMR